MSEALSAMHGALAAFSLVGVGAAWFLARRAEMCVRETKKEAAGALGDIRSQTALIAASHNDLVKTQAEQGQAIERLSAEVASRSLRR